MDRTLCTKSAAAKTSVISSRYVLFLVIFLLLVLFLCLLYCTVLVAHNGFGFDFLFLVAEVKRRKLDDIFSKAHLYYADTLYDSRRVSEKHSYL